MNRGAIPQQEHTMSDEELDRDWKPSGRRPQSTIARSFSQELMDIFRIENSVADLDEQVDKRKQQVTSQSAELEALEARIREMEERLKAPPVPQRANPNAAAQHRASPSSPRHQRVPVSNTFSEQQQQQQQHYEHKPALPAKDHHSARGDSRYAPNRPGTARSSQQAVPGALPPTPVASEGEYEPQQHHAGAVSDSASADFVFVRRPDGDGEYET